jgi:hypothetical protein
VRTQVGIVGAGPAELVNRALAAHEQAENRLAGDVPGDRATGPAAGPGVSQEAVRKK